MDNYSLFIKLNAFEDSMVRLGDGLRMSILAFRELNNRDIFVKEETLYEMLIDLSTYTNKTSLDQFYNYIVEYLMSEGEYISNNISYVPSKLFFYIIPEEIKYKDIQIPLPLFNFFYYNLWKDIVKISVFDYIHLGTSYTPRNLFISFNEYQSFYPNNNLKPEELCIKFLDDLDSFFRYNHIIQMKEFNLGSNGLDLYIPIHFNFTHLT